MAEICSEHNYEKAFFCATPECLRPAFVCLICVKNNHQVCNDKFFVHIDRMRDQIKFEGIEPSSEGLYSELENFLDFQISSLNTSLTNRKKWLLAELRRKEAFDEGDEFWSFIKSNSEIRLDEHDLTISIKSKLKNTKKILSRKVELFKEEVESQVRRFVESFGGIRFGKIDETEPIVEMNETDWLGSPSIQLSSSEGGVSFKRAPNSIEEAYHVRYLKLPTHKCKFLFSVDQVNPKTRFIDIGLFSGQMLPEISPKQKLENTKSSFSYCGYYLHKMTGKSLASVPDDPSGFEKGRSFVVQFEPGFPLRMFSEDRKLDLIAEKPCESGEDYYLFVTLYFKEAACTISVVD